MAEFFNLGLAPKVRLPSDSENDLQGLTRRDRGQNYHLGAYFKTPPLKYAPK